MLSPFLSELPPYLTETSGLTNGYMLAQYTAAALVAESRILSHPASVDSIPTSGDQEDHVSMGMTAALKLLVVMRNSQTILGIEALCAAQAIDLLAPLQPGHGTARAYQIVRALAPKLENDRYLSPEIERAADCVARGDFAAVVRELRAAGDPQPPEPETCG
jgi:histidine ammonia-lyase